MKIDITQVSIWTSSGLTNANKFEVRRVVYENGSAKAECYLWSDTELGSICLFSQQVEVSQEQCSNWIDDASFFAVIAANAGLSPVEALI